MTNSTFSGNKTIAGLGGGIFNQGTLTVTDGVFSNNTNAGGGSTGGGGPS